MIDPFVDHQVRDGNISYGLSSAGYDARLAREFKVFTNLHTAIIDPKEFPENAFVNFRDVDYCIIPPNSHILGRTVEYFKMPQDILAVCLGKSTYARCGIIINVTPLEPGWEGHVTMEIANLTPLPAKVYADEGICQFLFFRTETQPSVSYAARKGKYQGQTGIVTARL
jgi:dCTP deaminase